MECNNSILDIYNDNKESNYNSDYIEFKSQCNKILSKTTFTKNDIEKIFMALEKILGTYKIRHTMRPDNKQKKNINESIWWYKIELNRVYDIYYKALSTFLSAYTWHTIKKGECATGVFIEKRELFLSKAVELLEERSIEEKTLCYIPEEVLDILMEMVRCDADNNVMDVIAAMARVKELGPTIKKLSVVKTELKHLFELLRTIVKTAMAYGTPTLIELLETLEGTETEYQNCSMSQLYTPLLYSDLLQAEIKLWIVQEFTKSCMFYFDPVCPRLASKIIIKSYEEPYAKEETFMIVNKFIKDIVYKILKYMIHPVIRVYSIQMELHNYSSGISVSKWNILSKAFKCEVLKCNLQFYNVTAMATSKIVENLFLSRMIKGSIHLTISPAVILCDELMKAISKKVRIESLTLRDFSQPQVKMHPLDGKLSTKMYTTATTLPDTFDDYDVIEKQRRKHLFKTGTIENKLFQTSTEKRFRRTSVEYDNRYGYFPVEITEEEHIPLTTSAIEYFICWMHSNNPSFFRHLRYLIISLVYIPQIFSTLSKIRFFGIEKLEIEFLEGEQTALDPSKNKITKLVNKIVFPLLKEVNIHNVQITEEEFELFHKEIGLIQSRYNKLFCPLGSSYIKQSSYTFRYPEHISLNIGIIFIVHESLVYEWAYIPKSITPRECLLCKSKFKNINDKAVILACGNIFHLRCIFYTFNNKRNPCCPLCRRKIHMHLGFAVAMDITFDYKRYNIQLH
ncbi:hypothetical protein NEOKW01_0556 [Nematocida sp. AWRm80]|nr:hypothetical protein NEOKW01_0556 [Nematocida sp. AWRm80]